MLCLFLLAFLSYKSFDLTALKFSTEVVKFCCVPAKDKRWHPITYHCCHREHNLAQVRFGPAPAVTATERRKMYSHMRASCSSCQCADFSFYRFEGFVFALSNWKPLWVCLELALQSSHYKKSLSVSNAAKRPL